MEIAINEVSLLLGSLISKNDLHLQVKNAAKVFFPACRAAELVICHQQKSSIDCPMEVVLREIRNAKNGDITIKELSAEFAEHVIEAMTEKIGSRQLDITNPGIQHLISFYLNTPASFKEKNAQFIMIADRLPRSAVQKAQVLRQQLSVALNRVVRLEQLSLTGDDGIKGHGAPAEYDPEICCSRGGPLVSPPKRPVRREFMSFFGSLNEDEAANLPNKFMNYLCEKTRADTGFLLMKLPGSNEFVCHYRGDRILHEPVCVDLEDELLSSVINSRKGVCMQRPSEDHMKTISTLLRTTGKSIQLQAAASESSTEFETPLQVHSMLCCPFFGQSTGCLIGIIFLLNKRESAKFTQTDESIVQECMLYTLPLLRYSLAYLNERANTARSDEMLKVAGSIFTHMMDLTDLLLMIMQEARNLTKAERCSVFLLDRETNTLVAKVLDGLPTSPHKNTQFTTSEGRIVTLPEEIRLHPDQGIAGNVATTGELLNIKDAYKHPLFYRGVDEETGFRTRNILCFPIKDEKNGIVGVAQLCNKIGFPHFTHADEELAKAFAVYCCISIVHSLMYKRIQDAQNRARLANELLTYHMQVSEDKAEWLTTCNIPSVNTLLSNPASFLSIPREIKSEDDSFLALLGMFEDLKLINKWRLSRRTLAHFILMVCRGYRNPAYHNWIHAFSVTHFVYICGKNLPLAGKFLKNIEFLALFVASLCHDIDHRGTNNTFQLQSKSLLAALYSSDGSVLERHHFSQTICILNTPGCNIFEHFSEKQYGQMLDLIRDIILATDLAHHINISANQKQMVAHGYDVNDEGHHQLLLALLMTAADLSDQTKSWRNTVGVAELIYEEFFRQGDLEKAIGQNPVDSMDRERACVPQLQISFLDYIISPLYETFVRLFPQASAVIANIRRNRSRWKHILERAQRGELNANGLQIFNHDLIDDAQYPKNGSAM
ncbi:cGMP-dependent 3' 5'-cyclic phosphodiesterase [Clonorchis sinensis]|uniref:Phosphodiesterase n=2 Tax=Clonorchis sinensis TaxID=79923 RepID=H2KQX0_CLOSI|nr:cGMP-dependent 3' 5'-cyclic phosphodiesterase [Clonorchis sinensis]